MKTLVIEVPDKHGDLEYEWRVESMPGNTKVYTGKAVGAVAFKADPGKYVWNAIASNKYKKNGLFKYGGTIFHDLTEDQWKKVQYAAPKIARPVHTHKGVIWKCKFVGCDKAQTSRVAAAIHEAAHQGIDLLAEPERVAEAAEAVEAAAADHVPDKRGPGRPRKTA